MMVLNLRFNSGMKKIVFIVLVLLSSFAVFSQDSSYVFAANAKVNVCGSAFLQKISDDNIADLNIELVVSKIPNNKRLNVEDNKGMINGLFIKYATGNTYVKSVCGGNSSNQISKPAVATYRLISGKFKVVQNKDDNSYYSVEFKNLVFKDEKGSIVILVKENFENLKLGW
jgi:hypothetical protein